MFKLSRSENAFSRRRRTVLRTGGTLAAAGVLVYSVGAVGTPPVDIPALNASVDALLFYESALGIPDQADRKYNTEFFASQARYINWELRLRHPAPGRKLNFRIDATYLDPKGQVKAEHYLDTYYAANWTSSIHSGGYGNDTPGVAWSPGTYRLDVFIAGSPVASDTFTIIPGAGEVTAPDIPPAEKLEIPEDLGEL
ncbi:hypothetical protein ACFL1S_03520 [Pseudomonadota bacterium]